MKDCLFCRIIKGEVPSSKVYEDEDTYAFLDIGPVNKGHLLVIPKEHHENIYEIPDETLSRVIKSVKKVSMALKKATDSDGINVMQSNENAAGQVIFHIHFHIIPRFSGDGLKHWNQTSYSEGEMDAMMDKITQSL